VARHVEKIANLCVDAFGYGDGTCWAEIVVQNNCNDHPVTECPPPSNGRHDDCGAKGEKIEGRYGTLPVFSGFVAAAGNDRSVNGTAARALGGQRGCATTVSGSFAFLTLSLCVRFRFASA
jgi:hypothetical protein